MGYCSMSAKGLILKANLTATTMLGVVRSKLVGQRISRFIRREDQDIFYRNRKLLLESGKPQTFELRMVKYDGTPFWAHLEANASPVADGPPELRFVLTDITERKHAEKELIESAEELRSANENIKLAERAAKAGAYSWNFKTGETKWSAEFFRLFGLDVSNNKASYQTFKAALHPEDLQKAEMEVAAAIRDRKPFVQEYRVVLPGGGTRWIAGHGELVCDDAGQPQSLTGFCIDITKSKEVEEALHESERFARTTVDALTANLAVLDEKGTIIAVNRSWRRFAQDNECELDRVSEGVNYLAVCDAATGANVAGAAEMAAGIRSVISGERDKFIEERACDSPSGARWFECRVTRFSGEGATRVVVAHEDITERKQAENTVRKLSRAVEQSPISVVITDRAGNIEYVNTQFEKKTGYALAEVLGRNPRILKSGRTPAEIYREMWRVISAGGEWRGELSNRRKDGELLWESAAISGLKDENGQITHFVAAKEDIGERKQAAEAVWQARQSEVRIGSSLQRSLRGELPASFEGVWLAAYAEPSQGIDGDFCALRRFSPDCFEILVGDVMGKGVAAALMGAGIMSAYGNALVDLLAAGKNARALPTPAAIVNAMHRALTPQLIALSAFATLALYRFDLDAGTLTWVNAGHTQGLLTTGADSRPVAIMGDNLPIGVLAEEVYVQSSLAVGPGDSLLVFSDGITEARNAAGEEFGLERLCGLIEPGSMADLPPATMLHALCGEQRRFTGGGPGTDDLTALMVKLHPRRRAPRGRIEDRVEPFVFTLPWSLEGLGGLRACITECAGSLPDEAADALILASFEAATNIIRYSRLLVGNATLTCRITRTDDALAVELIYPSAAFTPPAEVQPDLSGESESGFGLFIMEQSVDSVEYASPMSGIASVRLVKRTIAVAA